MFAVLMLSTATGAWQAGRWMDRAGRRPALATAFVVAAVGALLVGTSLAVRSFALALMGSAVMGYGTGAGQLARLAAADMYPVRQRAKAVSYVLIGAAVGTIIGPVGTAALEKWATANGVNPIAAPWFAFPIAYLLGVAAILMLRPDPRTIAIRIAELDSETRGVMHVSALRTRGELLRMRPVWAAIVAIAALETTMVMIMAIVPLGMADLGYSLPLISTLIAVHFIGMFALSIPAGWVAEDRPQAGTGGRLPGLRIRLRDDRVEFRRVARGRRLLLCWAGLVLNLSNRNDHPRRHHPSARTSRTHRHHGFFGSDYCSDGFSGWRRDLYARRVGSARVGRGGFDRAAIPRGPAVTRKQGGRVRDHCLGQLVVWICGRGSVVAKLFPTLSQ
jgi:MFS family permease